MKEHSLKTWPAFFQRVWDGDKPFELRKDDRNYEEGDILILKEWHPGRRRYTGRGIIAVVKCIVRDAPEFGLMPGHCIMGIREVDRYPTPTPPEPRQ